MQMINNLLHHPCFDDDFIYDITDLLRVSGKFKSLQFLLERLFFPLKTTAFLIETELVTPSGE